MGVNTETPVNVSWVCFDCRTERRLPKYSRGTPVCTACGKGMTLIGDRLRVPKKKRDRAWKILRKCSDHPNCYLQWLRKINTGDTRGGYVDNSAHEYRGR